ncbi:MAG: YraN family protein [Candidatus Pacebacteria bacterium]|nr:YraN family protein [Candidatus Paceibacterota bacterium]
MIYVTRSVKPLLELKKKALLSNKRQLPHNFRLGRAGEQQAADYLTQKGYQVLATNFRFKKGELDLVAWDPELQELVFVEVKTRETNFYGHPSRAVDRAKLRSMQYTAAVFRRKHRLDKDYRFDIITVLPGKTEHFKNITWGRK